MTARGCRTAIELAARTQIEWRLVAACRSWLAQAVPSSRSRGDLPGPTNKRGSSLCKAPFLSVLHGVHYPADVHAASFAQLSISTIEQPRLRHAI